MRIASNTVSDGIVRQIQQLGVQQARLQTQVSTGLRISQPDDDPAAIGRVLSRLEYAGAMLRVESENLSAAVAGITDVGIAAETTRLARYNIIAQSATAMAAQANQSSNRVFKVLQN